MRSAELGRNNQCMGSPVAIDHTLKGINPIEVKGPRIIPTSTTVATLPLLMNTSDSGSNAKNLGSSGNCVYR